MDDAVDFMTDVLYEAKADSEKKQEG